MMGRRIVTLKAELYNQKEKLQFLIGAVVAASLCLQPLIPSLIVSMQHFIRYFICNNS